MKRRTLIYTLIACAILIPQLDHDRFLVLYDIRDHKALMDIPLDDSNEFTMRWIHSVELEPWEETFRIDDDLEIILDRTRFKAFGAGVPESAGKRVDTSDGYINFLDIDQPMESLVYSISPVAKHTLIVGNQEYPLYKDLSADIGVEFIIEEKLAFLAYFR
ncbi:DUF1850 domain-containing protein [Fusibacter sp. JL216-2]|uniref:DUF1850 domain-containing protein n=1 Tax=Fusibacter sp. JL216-2 TaxID=3071453 RepID=UPI003D325554